jgi:hypothetical protein
VVMCSASLNHLNGSLRNARRRVQWGEGFRDLIFTRTGNSSQYYNIQTIRIVFDSYLILRMSLFKEELI